MAAVVMGLTGCAGLNDPGSDLTPGGPGDATDDTPGASLPLLRIHRAGGFVPVGTDFANVPELTVYPDGRAIAHGPQIAIFPPPALPNLLVHELDDADLDALVTAAREAGLLDDVAPGYGQPPVADAPTTFVTLHVDGRTYEHAAEALGIGDGAQPAADPEETAGSEEPAPAEDRPGDELLPGLTDEERAARAELAAFIDRARELVGTSEQAEPYTIDAFAVMAWPAAGDVGPDLEGTPSPTDEGGAGATGSSPEGLERQVLAWPLDVALADAGECILVAGEEARTIHDALVGLGSTALFEQDGVRYDVWFRPLLPHEEGCDDV